MVFGVPIPLDPPPAVPPAEGVPTPDDLIGVLNGLADPGVPFASKSGLVEGGIGGLEAHAADKKLQKANQKGQLPLTFSVANITPTAPGAATADVTTSGPQMAPRTLNIGFVDQDGWKLSRSSAMSLLQTVSNG